MKIRQLPWLLERLIANERKYLRQYDVPLTTIPRLWRNGYFSSSALLYDLDRLDLYLSHVDQYNTKQINGAMGQILRNKYAAKKFLEGQFTENLAETYGFVRNGRFEDLFTDAESLSQLVSDVGSVVCKPISAGRGQEVFVIEQRDEKVNINGVEATTCDIRDLESGLSDHLVVEK